VIGILAAALALGIGTWLASRPFFVSGIIVLIALGALLARIRWSESGWRLMIMSVLLGYIVLTRGFAYSSIDVGLPLYVGELALLGSLLGVRHMRDLPAFMRAPGSVWLLLWITLGAALAVTQVQTYGVETLRDSAIFYYAIFAYIGYAFVEEPKHARALQYVLAAGFILHTLYSLSYAAGVPDLESLPVSAPGSNFPLFTYRHDASSVNLFGGVLFAFLIGRQLGWPAWVRWLVALPQFVLFLGFQVRAAYFGALLACVVLAYARKVSQVVRLGLGVLLILGFMMAANVEVFIPGQTARTLSADRILDSVTSMFDLGGTRQYRSADAGTSVGNAQWRMGFWDQIISRNLETVSGTLLGIGFGPDLVTGWSFWTYEDRPNRNPHNILITLFGRMGLVGLTLWILFIVMTLMGILRGYRASAAMPARRDQLVFLLAYVVTMFGAACFGVLLESPFMAIPFYFLLGVAARLAGSSVASVGSQVPVRLARAGRPASPLVSTPARVSPKDPVATTRA
jgi:O-Antigen ligase